ncbi:mechanosensitive ion channel family protein [uncultured Cohaesibacter sp.]|uniref:mechanosensitive ion channel family protein n=1 Tax=uncultured Cohaesibacter sp. TaxID=1002546 RepID=UPI0029C8F8F9|nr:mechanosensitive ion channel family protein [uncultured Cohaesibacter sp.]
MEEQLDSLNQNVDAAVQTVNGLTEGFFALLPQAAIAVVVLILMVLIASVVKRVVKRVVTMRASAGVGTALSRIAYTLTIFAGLLFSVAIVAPSIGAAELLQVLGVGSVAIGFAFRDILQNFLAGLLLLLRQPFFEGDWVKFGNHEGIVKEISTRSTWIKTFDGRDISIPNGEIFTNSLTVMTRDPMIRSDYEFGISYDADIEKAKNVILEVAKKVKGVSSEKGPDIGVSDLADSSVNLRLRWWTTTDDVYGAKLEMLQKVKEALDAADIPIPFPHRQLILDDDALEAVAARHGEAAVA